MRPMRAFRYADKPKHITYPAYIQPKLNGIRMLYRAGLMQSSSRGLDEAKIWPPHRLRHLREELEQIPSHFLLDGEIYVHGWSLQSINGAAAINRNDDGPKSLLLEYHVFDVVDTRDLSLPFSERNELLTQLASAGMYSSVNFVETLYAPTEDFAMQQFRRFKELRYEGAMWRSATAPYGLGEKCGNKENRWPCLLKLKDWLDEVCSILDFELTEGSKGERGFTMTLALPNGKVFSAGSGLSDMEVERFAQNPPIGGKADVKFEMYSDGGMPLKPTIECVYPND